MTSRANSWQQIRSMGWADEVDEDWRSSGDLASPVFDDATNHYRTADGVWHEDINVERGQSQHRLDLDSGFMRSIRQNQYARDEHEQAWQDAYGNAPSFQQKWGVGVKVQPQQRGDEGQWQHSPAPHGVTRREDQPEGAMDKPWWRKAADIQHATEVRILSRSEAERRAMPGREPEPLHQSAEAGYHRPQMPEAQHDSAPAVSHEILEAQLLRRNRASAEARHSSYTSTQGSRLSQQGPPLIDSQGIAMGIPVEWAMGPSAHPSMQPYTHAEVQQQDAPPPAEAPRDVVSPPALEHHAEQVEGAAKPARQEKVKMGFQLYRPPTLLASTPAEALQERSRTREVSEQPHAGSDSHAVPSAGRRPSRRPVQPQSPQQDESPSQAAVRAVHAASKDEIRAPSKSSRTKATGREPARHPKQDNGKTLRQDPRCDSSSKAPAARKESAPPLPNSSASTEKRRGKKSAAGVAVAALIPEDAKSGRNNRGVANREAVSLAKKSAQQPLSSGGKAESRAAPCADDSAVKQSSRRAGRASAVWEQTRKVSCAEQRSRPSEEHGERPECNRQPPGMASEQAAGGRGARESKVQPKQLLTELVKQAAVFNASHANRQVPSAQATAKAASRPAAPSRGGKLAAPPGLETVMPAAAALRKAAA